MPGLEQLTTDAQLKSQAKTAHLIRLQDAQAQWRAKREQVKAELAMIERELTTLEAQLASAKAG